MRRFESAERGQALVVVILLLIGLLVVVGLAVDGGIVFLERRRMQNAADASALAGARLLAEGICGDPDAVDAAIAAEVNRYAEENGVQDTGGAPGDAVNDNVSADYIDFERLVLGRVGAGSIPVGATGISTTVKIERPTHLVTLIGFDAGGAMAHAIAMASPPRVAGGLRPFGVPLQIVQQAGAGDCFTFSFKHCDVDSPDDCWIQDDTGDMIGQHRNWMNMNHIWNQGEADSFPRASGSSGSADELKEWMESGWDGALTADCYWSVGCRAGDFIHAKPGTDSSIIGRTPVDELFFVPVFDLVPSYDQIPAPKAAAVPQGGDYYYHIVGFAGLRVPTAGDANQGEGTIRACLEQAVMGEGSPSPREGEGFGEASACPTHTMLVALME